AVDRLGVTGGVALARWFFFSRTCREIVFPRATRIETPKRHLVRSPRIINPLVEINLFELFNLGSAFSLALLN
ncbi:hypothetical protein ABTQ05_21655, partial [Acinetobacter baumannii]